jgi:hypothetical protein
MPAPCCLRPVAPSRAPCGRDRVASQQIDQAYRLSSEEARQDIHPALAAPFDHVQWINGDRRRTHGAGSGQAETTFRPTIEPIAMARKNMRQAVNGSSNMMMPMQTDRAEGADPGPVGIGGADGIQAGVADHSQQWDTGPMGGGASPSGRNGR